MLTRGLFFVTLLSCVILQFTTALLQYKCQHERVYPYLSDVIVAALPKTYADHPKVLDFLGLYGKYLEIPIPLISWIFDVKYTIKLNASDSAFDTKNVFLVYENKYQRNLTLASIPENGVFSVLYSMGCDAVAGLPYSKTLYLDQICKCPRKRQLSDLVQSNYSPELKDDWCYRKSVCGSSSDKKKGFCEVSIDPLRKSCILIDTKENTNLDEFVTVRKFYPRLTSYLPTGWLMNEEKSAIVDVINEIVYFLPFYPINLLVGLYIVGYAKEIAERPFVQKLIEAIFGLGFALLLLYFISQNVINRLFANRGDALFKMLQFPFAFYFSSFLWSNPSYLAIVRDILYEFWSKGAFGLPWLGKAYFASCILLSWSISSYFAFFSPSSRFWPLILFMIRAVGYIFLANASSTSGTALLFILLGIFLDQIMSMVVYFMIQSKARSTRIFSNHKTVTPEELKAVTALATKKALLNLRRSLRSDNTTYYRAKDKLFEGGKKHLSELLTRFVEGNHPGVPYTVTKEELEKDEDIDSDEEEELLLIDEELDSKKRELRAKREKIRSRRLLRNLFVVALVGVISYFVARNYTQVPLDRATINDDSGITPWLRQLKMMANTYLK